MIRLLVDNKYEVYLDPDTKLRLEYQMPLPDVEGIPMPVIYPFNIPVAGNESTFSHGHFMHAATRTSIYNVTFYFHGFPILKGKFYIKTITHEYYRGSIIFNSFSDGFSDQKLNELVYEDIDIGGDPHSSDNVVTHAEDIINDISDADYTFPVIYAPNFYGEPDEDGIAEFNPDYGQNDGVATRGKYINNFNRDTQSFPTNAIREDPDCDNIYTMVPCPYVHPLIRKIFSDERFSCFGSFLDDEELQKLIIFYNFPIDQKYKKFFVKATDDAYHEIEEGGNKIPFPDDSTIDNEDADDVWNITTSKLTIGSIGYHSVIITMRVKPHYDINYSTAKAILGMKNEGGTIDFSQEFIVDVDNEYHDLTFTIDIYLDGGYVGDLYQFWFKFIVGEATDYYGDIINGILTVFNTSYQNLNQFSNTLNIANHLPPVDIKTFINAIKKGLGLMFFFDFQMNETQISFIKDIVTSGEYLDLTDNLIAENSEIEISEGNGYTLDIDFDEDVYTFDNYEYLGEYDTFADFPTPSEPNKIALDKSTNVLNIFKLNTDTNTFQWYFWSDNIFPVVTGDGETEVTAEFSTLAMHLGNDLLTAQTRVIANSPAFETGDNDFPLTILFYRGMQIDANGDDFPMASCVNYDIDGVLLGQYQSIMNGDYGLYNVFLKKWYDLITTAEEIKRSFLLSPLDFINLTKLFLPQRGNEVRKVRFDGLNVIPRKASFILSQSGVEQCEIVSLKFIEDLSTPEEDESES